MFKKKDYVTYFDQLYKIEVEMEREGRDLLKMVNEPEAQELLRHLIREEVEHKKIVKSLKNLIS
ncbi:MAG: hypothetical protein WCT54_05125 [Patescibacteria group bacterium]|jgi:rubrerythrin